MSSPEKVKAKDEVTLILYDKDGNIKQSSTSKKKKKYLNFLKLVLEKW